MTKCNFCRKKRKCQPIDQFSIFWYCKQCVKNNLDLTFIKAVEMNIKKLAKKVDEDFLNFLMGNEKPQ